MKTLLLGALAMVATASMLYKGQDTVMQQEQPEKVTGYKVVDGRFAEGPYAGYLVGSPEREDKVVLTEEEWKERLTPEQFRILRQHGTEPAFCGIFHDHKQPGVYAVAGTGQPVFSSFAKFDSGTGWPSFFKPVNEDAIWLRPDFSFGMVRMEVLASQCDGHLGHVFPDGPRESGGLRFCINSEALEFIPASRAGGASDE